MEDGIIESDRMVDEDSGMLENVQLPPLPSNDIRFTQELEFVQMLCQPGYLHHLAQNKYFEDREFLDYLEYLMYWLEPEYTKFLIYPNCVDILQVLQHKRFRDSLQRQDFRNYLNEQIGMKWMYYRLNREKKEVDEDMQEGKTDDQGMSNQSENNEQPLE